MIESSGFQVAQHGAEAQQSLPSLKPGVAYLTSLSFYLLTYKAVMLTARKFLILL